MINFKKGKTRDEKINTFLDNVAWWHSSKDVMDQTARRIEVLNEKIDEATKSSTRLATALNKITLFGSIIAGMGVIIAIINVVLSHWQLISQLWN